MPTNKLILALAEPSLLPSNVVDVADTDDKSRIYHWPSGNLKFQLQSTGERRLDEFREPFDAAKACALGHTATR